MTHRNTIRITVFWTSAGLPNTVAKATVCDSPSKMIDAGAERDERDPRDLPRRVEQPARERPPDDHRRVDGVGVLVVGVHAARRRGLRGRHHAVDRQAVQRPEPDRERLALRAPLVAPELRHQGQREHRVAGEDHRQGAVAGDRDELEPDEEHEADDGGPQADAGGSSEAPQPRMPRRAEDPGAGCRAASRTGRPTPRPGRAAPTASRRRPSRRPTGTASRPTPRTCRRRCPGPRSTPSRRGRRPAARSAAGRGRGRRVPAGWARRACRGRARTRTTARRSSRRRRGRRRAAAGSGRRCRGCGPRRPPARRGPPRAAAATTPGARGRAAGRTDPAIRPTPIELCPAASAQDERARRRRRAAGRRRSGAGRRPSRTAGVGRRRPTGPGWERRTTGRRSARASTGAAEAVAGVIESFVGRRRRRRRSVGGRRGRRGASATVNVSWPRSMSPSSADAEVHLIRYSPGPSVRPSRVILRGPVASPVPTLSPPASSSWNELFDGSRRSVNVSVIVVGGVSRTALSAGSAVSSSAWASAVPAARPRATMASERSSERATNDGARRCAHETGV